MPVSELTLRHCSLFKQAPPGVMSLAAGKMDILHLKKREILLLNGKPFRGLGVVLQGRLQAIDFTTDGREVALTTADTYDAFGQANLIASHPVALTWVAVLQSSIAVLPRQDALEMLNQPEMGLELARDLSQQVCDFLSWQKILSVHPVSARVCAWITWTAANQNYLDIPRHAELAWRLGTSRETITRTLQKLQADEILRREDDKWIIINLTLLNQLSLGDGRTSND